MTTSGAVHLTMCLAVQTQAHHRVHNACAEHLDGPEQLIAYWAITAAPYLCSHATVGQARGRADRRVGQAAAKSGPPIVRAWGSLSVLTTTQ
jgi:hypothetical protein